MKRAGALLEQRWYASLARGRPDYSVYEDPMYLEIAYECWKMYSRRYLREITRRATLEGGRTVLDDIGDVTRVIDVGCGVGYSTARIKEIWPKADVIGTNVPGEQFKIASALGAERGFSITSDVTAIPRPVDVVFASEYFEHFEMPTLHLAQLQTELSPRVWLIANTFSQRSTGHFDLYCSDGQMMDGPKMSRRFNATLRGFGYEKIEAGFWNGRPAYWRRP